MAQGRRRAGRPGGTVLAAVVKELAGGWPPGLTLLTGEDLYHLDAAQRKLLGALVSEEDAEYGLTVYSDRKVDVAEVVAAARSLGMFARRRVVLVRGIETLDGEPHALVEYAKTPPDQSYLIVRAPTLDRRRKLPQALVKSGRVLEFGPATDPSSAMRDVLSIAKSKRLVLDSAAASFLVELCGGDFYRVDTELEKIRCWLGAGGADKVGVALVREIAAGSGLLSGWEVADALLVRDRAAALAAMRMVMQAGHEPLMLLGGLAYRARGMLKAKAMIENGTKPDRALQAAGLWGIPPQVAVPGLARYSLRELAEFPRRLFDADRSLKSRSLAPEAVLGSLIDQMTRTPSPRVETR